MHKGNLAGRGEQSPTRLYSSSPARRYSQVRNFRAQKKERAERDKTWAQWNMAYKKAHAQARAKAQASNGTTKFRVANSAIRQDKPHPPLDNQLEEKDVGIKALEGNLDNLAIAAVNEKSVLQQLALNTTTLKTSNEILVTLVKKLTGT